jgi:hypothetical protein
MMGTSSQPGIIPRLSNTLFQRIALLSSSDNQVSNREVATRETSSSRGLPSSPPQIIRSAIERWQPERQALPEDCPPLLLR